MGKLLNIFLENIAKSIAQWGLSGTVADSLSCNIHPPLLEQWNGWSVTRYLVTKGDTVKVPLAGYVTRFRTSARIICASCKITLLNGVVMSFPSLSSFLSVWIDMMAKWSFWTMIKDP